MYIIILTIIAGAFSTFCYGLSEAPLSTDIFLGIIAGTLIEIYLLLKRKMK